MLRDLAGLELSKIMTRRDTGTPPPLERHSTLDRILEHDAVAALLLLSAAVAAFGAANASWVMGGAPLSEWYAALWQLPLGFSLHHLALEKPLQLWINDGLMAIFFFVVGLEIKRELLAGELSSVRRAVLPFAAALGGMIAPALIYAVLNASAGSVKGWGIPMATDIAFAAGVLGLLRSRVPNALAVFLLALAIVDDLGSVLVIAAFYTESIDRGPLFVGLGLILLSAGLARYGIRHTLVYLVLFLLIWLEFFHSGIHATVAGVLFAFTVPVNATYDTPLFVSRLRTLLGRFDAAEDHAHPRLVNARQQQLLRAIETECVHVEAPLQRIENKLHVYVALFIMPLFACANSGVKVELDQFTVMMRSPVTLGVLFGLVLGKQAGVLGGAWLAVRLGLAELPAGTQWRQMYALSWLAGIGFTMSLFVAELAFGGDAHDLGRSVPSPALAEAKLGILLASLIAGSIGAVLLRLVSPRKGPELEPGI
ncbi:MAG: Na+/H+ antiporter NhaA [Candidatus Hydrogenedentes bacterium]|nr:Na+/H+ antiporter NhaA [Candidatus Hydrogenedentota bacterium]